jgi:hypothetical protein
MPEPENDETSRERLRQAVSQSVVACDANAALLWEMSYTISSLSIDSPPSSTSLVTDSSGRMIAFQPSREDIAFDDTLLDAVKAVWEKIIGPLAAESEFMRFEERPGEETEEY